MERPFSGTRFAVSCTLQRRIVFGVSCFFPRLKYRAGRYEWKKIITNFRLEAIRMVETRHGPFICTTARIPVKCVCRTAEQRSSGVVFVGAHNVTRTGCPPRPLFLIYYYYYSSDITWIYARTFNLLRRRTYAVCVCACVVRQSTERLLLSGTTA